jgi:hypothetical protein
MTRSKRSKVLYPERHAAGLEGGFRLEIRLPAKVNTWVRSQQGGGPAYVRQLVEKAFEASQQPAELGEAVGSM